MVDFVGNSGNDTFIGTEGTDTATGGFGDDSLVGNGGGDLLAGEDGADYLDGGAGSDSLYSRFVSPFFDGPYYSNPWTSPLLDTGIEIDTLVGGDGNDKLFAGYGDNVDGGADYDTLYISFQGATSGVTADFRLASLVIGGGTITGIEGVDWVEGSNFDDDITMNNLGSYTTPVFGMGGNDRLVAGYYTSALYGGDGNDVLDATIGGYLRTLDGGAGDDTLDASLFGIATTRGGDGNDTIHASYLIYGDAGNDTIYALSGYRSFTAFGGSGDDTIYNSPSIAGNYGGTMYGDEGADSLFGNEVAEIFVGGAGNDAIDGAGEGPFAITGDVSVYSGTIADYQVSKDSITGAVTVMDLRAGSPDGTDTLKNIELLKFTNGTYGVNVVVAGKATGVENYVGTPGADEYHGSDDGNTAIGYDGIDSFFGEGGNDVLQGNGGGDHLNGGAGSDTLYSANKGPAFTPPYYGNAWSAPLLDIGSDIDTLAGGTGNDTLFAGFGDNVDGGDGDDTLYISFLAASEGVTADFRLASQTIGGGTISSIESLGWVEGSNFDDNINLGAIYGYQITHAFGLGGNDVLVAGYYTGTIWGGDGNDFVDGRGSQYLQAVYGDAGDDTLFTSTNSTAPAYGGEGDDTIFASRDIRGDAGNDIIFVQQSYYGPGQVRGGLGDDTIHVQHVGHSQIFGDDGADLINGSSGNDTLDGGAGDDTIAGGGGTNLLRGGSGNDRFELATTDTGTVVEGGADFDTLAVVGAFTLGGASSGIENIDLDSGTLTLTSSQFGLSLAATTQLTGTGSIVVMMQPGFVVNGANFIAQPGSSLTISVNGSGANDTITGIDAITNLLFGAGGADTLTGGTGNDTLDGGAGANLLFGGGGNDRLMIDALASSSAVDGGTGNDTLVVSGSVASFNAIAGFEAIELAAGSSLTLTGAQVSTGFVLATAVTGTGSLTINMTAGLLLPTKLWSIAPGIAVTINGTSGTDIMKLANAVQTVNGGDGSDQIKGGNLVDTINGGAGIDKIIGQGGADILTGGTGNDVFRYIAQGDSGIGAAADQITDFTIGQDRLNFKDIDADAVTVGDQAFAFIGAGAFTSPGTGQIRFQDSGADLLVQVDVNGDGAADMEVILQGVAGQMLNGTDFVL